MNEASGIHLGTSAFQAAGWPGTFYPRGMKPRDYLTFYAEHFDTVEVDSTFYRTPSIEIVSNWSLKTPEEFIFSVKVPQIVTHEKILVGCDAEFEQFVDVMDILQDKLGPMVLQFPFFNRSIFRTQSDFLDRFIPFLKKLPRDLRKRGVTIYAYANNHYAGFAPATIEQFRELWYAKGLPELGRGRRFRQESSLFDGLEE